MSNEGKKVKSVIFSQKLLGSSKGRSLRSSSRPSLLKEVDVTALSLHFGISLSSGSESSDKEFTPPKDDDGSGINIQYYSNDMYLCRC